MGDFELQLKNFRQLSKNKLPPTNASPCSLDGDYSSAGPTSQTNPGLWTTAYFSAACGRSQRSELKALSFCLIAGATESAVKRQLRPENPSPLTPVIPKAVGTRSTYSTLIVFIIRFQENSSIFQVAIFISLKSLLRNLNPLIPWHYLLIGVQAKYK